MYRTKNAFQLVDRDELDFHCVLREGKFFIGNTFIRLDNYDEIFICINPAIFSVHLGSKFSTVPDLLE